MHDGDVSTAHRVGLHCRPILETVTDTWTWLQAEGRPEPKPGSPRPGLEPVKEKTVLDQLLNR
jgi:hypothetical protein